VDNYGRAWTYVDTARPSADQEVGFRVPPGVQQNCCGATDSRVATCVALAETLAEARGVGPNLDFGLVAMSGALGLDRGSAAAIFAIGRCAGWVAHVREQYEAGYLVRPRARYHEA
jgi:citrate synthase